MEFNSAFKGLIEYASAVRVCLSFTVNDQWGIAWEHEVPIHFTASPLRYWDRTYEFSDLESTDDLYICSCTKYKILNTSICLL
jgi:hypothetical protein